MDLHGIGFQCMEVCSNHEACPSASPDGTVKTEGLLGAFSLSILWLPWIHYISRWLVRETKYRKAVSRNKATGGLIS